MTTYQSTLLLEDLQQQVRTIIATVKEQFEEAPMLSLLKQPAPGKWSVGQVITHLNSYNTYYLPALVKALAAAKARRETAQLLFKPGWLGNYFTKLMQPGADGSIANKMQSPKEHRPVTNLDAKAVLEEFLLRQEALLEYLEMAKEINIGKRYVPISISKMIKLKIGDTFRFLIAHQQRHLLQAMRALQAVAPTQSMATPA